MREKAVKNRPEVLILCQLFYPELVSTGQTLTELCEVLVDLGVKIEVVCGPPTIIDQESKIPRCLEYKGIKITRVWGTRFPKLNFMGKFINQLTFAISVFFHLLFEFSKRPILVVTNPPFLGAICAILRATGGNPYIYLLFDVYPDTAIKLGVIKDKSLIAKLWDWWNSIILKKASAVIVLGRRMKEVILNKGKRISSLHDKIHLVHVWSDDRKIQPLDRINNPFIKKWNLNGKFVVSYSGNMGRFHDLETIMESARELKVNKNILFLFIGEGYKKKWMEEYAKKWKLSNCQFHTYVNRDDLGLSLACAHVGLVSLLPGQEGLSVPSKTFGILAAGVPVIAVMPRTSEIALIMEENNCGIVVEPGDVPGLVNSIVRLYNNSELCKILGKNAIEAIKSKYSLKNAALKYFSIIESFQY
jgi:glycosyltransferase involved in cell wall biosynthesis